jgi:protein-S-isoprenylcysteine O-methyltransferase Ste14
LLLIILLGPLTAYYHVWELPVSQLGSIVLGIIVFLPGTFVYFKWELFWHRTYKGQLVTGGIFQYIRHPHYTSLLIVGFGLAFFFYSLAALLTAVLAIPIMIWSIIDEEKVLTKQYGDAYKEYMKKVPWRMIPKIF